MVEVELAEQEQRLVIIGIGFHRVARRCAPELELLQEYGHQFLAKLARLPRFATILGLAQRTAHLKVKRRCSQLGCFEIDDVANADIERERGRGFVGAAVEEVIGPVKEC